MHIFGSFIYIFPPVVIIFFKFCDQIYVTFLPEAVRKGLHSPLGWAVSSPNEVQSPEYTGHVYHSASGLLQEWNELQGHINESYQVDIQNLREIL